MTNNPIYFDGTKYTTNLLENLLKKGWTLEINNNYIVGAIYTIKDEDKIIVVKDMIPELALLTLHMVIFDEKFY